MIGTEGKRRNGINNCWVTIISHALSGRKWRSNGLIGNSCFHHKRNSDGRDGKSRVRKSDALRQSQVCHWPEQFNELFYLEDLWVLYMHKGKGDKKLEELKDGLFLCKHKHTYTIYSHHTYHMPTLYTHTSHHTPTAQKHTTNINIPHSHAHMHTPHTHTIHTYQQTLQTYPHHKCMQTHLIIISLKRTTNIYHT